MECHCYKSGNLVVVIFCNACKVTLYCTTVKRLNRFFFFLSWESTFLLWISVKTISFLSQLPSGKIFLRSALQHRICYWSICSGYFLMLNVWGFLFHTSLLQNYYYYSGTWSNFLKYFAGSAFAVQSASWWPLVQSFEVLSTRRRKVIK